MLITRGLKARLIGYGSGFQPLVLCARYSWGVAPGWYGSRLRRWPHDAERDGQSFRRLSVAIGTYRLHPVVVQRINELGKVLTLPVLELVTSFSPVPGSPHNHDRLPAARSESIGDVDHAI